jgi:hypothetical protein
MQDQVMITLEADEELVQQLLGCSDDPLAFVNLAFPDIKPEKWQREVLKHIGNQLQENTCLDRWKAVMVAVASGNGIGKSALLAWIVLWAVITFEDTRGVVTAGTESQLRTRLWGEVSKWFSQLPEPLRSMFTLTATALFNKQSERNWRVDACPWTERNREAFSGLHNLRKRVLVIYDECSMIPEPIWRATISMLSDAETEIIWCVFGNPTRIDGVFPTLFPPGDFARMWWAKNVDSRDVSLTDKAAIQEKLDYYGAESNYARSHVYGRFPLATARSLIPSDRVEMAAVRRDAVAHSADAIILGVDVASGHSTSISVVAVRQGLDARSLGGQFKFPGVNPTDLVYEVAAIANKVGATAIHVDATGVGEGTVSRLRELGYPAHPVTLGSRAPHGDVRCANMRAYCWTMMAAWTRVGAIQNDAELKAQLCAPEYSETERGVIIEKKEHMADRGLASPDCADALSLTFAYPAYTAAMNDLIGPGDHQVLHEYNPFSDAAMEGRALPESKVRYSAPGYRLKPEWSHPDWTGDDWLDAQASDALTREIWNEPKD